jgi:hypothetical protein
MSFKFRYAIKDQRSKYGKPRKMFPNNWTSGPDPVMHEMYYAWAKHKSQANYRKEDYDLTWEDWQVIWANHDDFLRRGRKPDDLALTRKDYEKPWTLSNCEVVTRLEQIRRSSFYTQKKKK